MSTEVYKKCDVCLGLGKDNGKNAITVGFGSHIHQPEGFAGSGSDPIAWLAGRHYDICRSCVSMILAWFVAHAASEIKRVQDERATAAPVPKARRRKR